MFSFSFSGGDDDSRVLRRLASTFLDGNLVKIDRKLSIYILMNCLRIKANTFFCNREANAKSRGALNGFCDF